MTSWVRTALRRAGAIGVVAAVSSGLWLAPSATAKDAGPVAGTGDGVRLAIAEVDLDGPAISPVTVTVTNGSAASLQQVRVSLRAPIGWSVAPDVTSVSGSVKPGSAVDVTFQVRVPEPTERFTLRTFTATATYKTSGQAGETSVTRTQHTGVAHADLASAYDNVGVSDESDPTAGNFDGDGNSYSAQALAAAGVTPGSQVEGPDATFTWPDVPIGSPDNVATRGQTIATTGQGERLAFLGAATGGGPGTVTVTYTDGSTSTATLGFPNWCCASPTQHGATPVVEMDHRNTPQGPANYGYTYRVFSNTIPLDASRTVAYVTLPSTAMHVFDMRIVAP